MSEHDYNPNGLHETLARIDANQQALLGEFKALRVDHDFDRRRINSLEKWKSWTFGFSAAVSAGIAWMVKLWPKGGHQ